MDGLLNLPASLSCSLGEVRGASQSSTPTCLKVSEIILPHQSFENELTIMEVFHTMVSSQASLMNRRRLEYKKGKGCQAVDQWAQSSNLYFLSSFGSAWQGAHEDNNSRKRPGGSSGQCSPQVLRRPAKQVQYRPPFPRPFTCRKGKRRAPNYEVLCSLLPAAA